MNVYQTPITVVPKLHVQTLLDHLVVHALLVTMAVVSPVPVIL